MKGGLCCFHLGSITAVSPFLRFPFNWPGVDTNTTDRQLFIPAFVGGLPACAAVTECKWEDGGWRREGDVVWFEGPKWKERDGKSAILIRLTSMIVISNWLTAFVVDWQTLRVCRLAAASLEGRLDIT